MCPDLHLHLPRLLFIVYFLRLPQCQAAMMAFEVFTFALGSLYPAVILAVIAGTILIFLIKLYQARRIFVDLQKQGLVS